MFQEKQVVTETDKYGVERFNAIKEQFKGRKLSKYFQSRYDKIVSVFTFRVDLAIKNDAVQRDSYNWYEKGDMKKRLAAFKPADFFIAALQQLLDELKKEEAGVLATKLAKKRQVVKRGW